MNKSLERLSSGYRINQASDDPAGLVASELLRAQLSGLEKAIQNTSQANNLMATADGALGEINNILKQMRTAATAAENLTSPDVLAANQLIIDAGIQQIDRLAASAKFADKPLLNGAQDISFSVSSQVSGTQNNLMLNPTLSLFNQIYQRNGLKLNVSFNGMVTGLGYLAARMGDAIMGTQAEKAYLEVDSALGSQLDADGYFTANQEFVLSGRDGSTGKITLSAGAHISELVSAIQSKAEATGVSASLTFNSSQQANKAAADASASAVGTVGSVDAGQQVVYGNYKSVNGTQELLATASAIDADSVVFGKNTDGQGNVHVKVTSTGFELYKDASMSNESLVGVAGSSGQISAVNNSGIEGSITLGSAAASGDIFRVSLGGVRLDDNNVATSGASGVFELGSGSASTASGVQLGTNTDADGSIHLRVEDAGGGLFNVYAYNNSLMREQDMVAKTAEAVSFTAGDGVVLDAVKAGGDSTGLGLTLEVGSTAPAGGDTMTIQFKNLGARIYASDYGSGSYVQVNQSQGGLFIDYSNQGNPATARLISPNTGDYRKYGQDAIVNVNGSPYKTNGLSLSFATIDLSAKLAFNSGVTGSTTIAQVGYGEGSVFSKNTSLAFSKSGLDADGDFTSPYAGSEHLGSLLNNASHYSTEIVGDFNGGMRFQLGTGYSSHDQTIVGIPGASSSSLGRMQVTKAFDPSSAVVYTKNLSLSDLMSGQAASLENDPSLALGIIEKADREVSMLRAQIGSFQSVALESNENNLRTAIENITKTESDIRDTDMAREVVNFTRSMILTNAGINLLATSNIQSEKVLKLLEVQS